MYTDIGRVIPVVLQFAMYLTPVVFAMPDGGIVGRLFRLNFMTPVIVNGQGLVDRVRGQSMHTELIIVCVSAAALLFVAWVLFRSTMSVLIERMSA